MNRRGDCWTWPASLDVAAVAAAAAAVAAAVAVRSGVSGRDWPSVRECRLFPILWDDYPDYAKEYFNQIRII